MAHAEGIVLAFRHLGEARHAAVAAVGGKAVAPAGQYLVPVRLVAHIPHELVVGRIEDVVQRHRQLDYPQRGAEVPAVDAHRVDNKLAQLGTDLH
jgi:hypothetical protein